MNTITYFVRAFFLFFFGLLFVFFGFLFIMFARRILIFIASLRVSFSLFEDKSSMSKQAEKNRP